MPLPDGKRTTRIMGLIADEYVRAILQSTITTPKSVRQLSQELGIPSSTCYRRIAELKKAGLLEVERTVLTKDGKKWEVYRSTVRRVTIQMGKSGWQVDVEVNEVASERLQRLWRALRGE